MGPSAGLSWRVVSFSGLIWSSQTGKYCVQQASSIAMKLIYQAQHLGATAPQKIVCSFCRVYMGQRHAASKELLMPHVCMEVVVNVSGSDLTI